MTFLFIAALFALPLAALPVILHLLFRRKSPVVHFPTLRFIKSAIQQTAARRKIQRWLLLACRVLLLALLIFSIAQPAKELASAWVSSSEPAVAAIVVDTSYSMLLRQDPSREDTTLLKKAEEIIQELLRDQLKDASVAIFQSLPPPRDKKETFRPVAAIQKDGLNLKPQPSPRKLSDRVNEALALLQGDPARQKWLFILTDVQSREFSQEIQAPQEIKTVLLDLHPDEPRSDGITSVTMDPEDPIPGIGSECVVEIAGRAGDSRAVALSVAKADKLDEPLLSRPTMMASFDSGGRAQVRFPLRLPAERFMAVKGVLQAPDALPWDNERIQIVEVPPKQPVTILEQTTQLPANRFLRLAMDASEGTKAEWPLTITRSPNLVGKESVAALNLTQWPEVSQANQLRDFVKGGGTLILCLQPGLEEAFKNVGEDAKTPLGELLPSVPTQPPTNTGAYRAAMAVQDDVLMRGLADKKFALDGIIVRRFVPMSRPEGKDVGSILNVVPVNPTSGARPFPLLMRKKLGSGQVFCFTTLPDPRYTNLPTHPLFLPLVVRMSIRAAAQRDVQNVELGSGLVLVGPQFNDLGELQIEGPPPLRETYVAQPKIFKDPEGKKTGQEYHFDRAMTPGIYFWRNPADNMKVVALTNVQYPSAEADLTYRAAKEILRPTETHLIARSLPDLNDLLKKAVEPEPRWALPISIVMLLLCFEALMGSFTRLWQPIKLPWLTAKPAEG